MTSTIRARLTQILHLHESPHRTSLAFSLGVVIAFSPTYGLHTASVFLLAYIFRLNVLAVLSGSLINNPWTLVPILGLTFWTGFQMTGQPPAVFDWQDQSLASIYEQAAPYLISFVAGGVTLSLVGGTLTYPIALFLISRYHSRRHGLSAKRAPLQRKPG